MKQSEHQQWLIALIVTNNLIIINNNKLWQRRQLPTEYLEKVKCVLLYFDAKYQGFGLDFNFTLVQLPALEFNR